ncbi:hypothetical protein K466DRAFT_75783 [Polyporus arcularius HHB13444]|uniref:Uncharacterized protein n=1 Tax=Polyporus arcularius HHB13444 TaxID=1314778 RepID=A0A5C3NQ50_9APHY|nr:hypothetical protein K466DRAFT_75783 [Polyporus arcularius HHB13444]
MRQASECTYTSRPSIREAAMCGHGCRLCPSPGVHGTCTMAFVCLSWLAVPLRTYVRLFAERSRDSGGSALVQTYIKESGVGSRGRSESAVPSFGSSRDGPADLSVRTPCAGSRHAAGCRGSLRWNIILSDMRSGGVRCSTRPFCLVARWIFSKRQSCAHLETGLRLLHIRLSAVGLDEVARGGSAHGELVRSPCRRRRARVHQLSEESIRTRSAAMDLAGNPFYRACSGTC